MTKTIVGGLVAASLLLGSAPLYAQETESVNYVYSTYFICNTADLGVADEIVREINAPLYDAAVKAGEITAWGWMAHHTGGVWRRALYYIAPSIDELLDASDSIGAAADEAAPEAGRVFSEACPSHEDYIWQTAPGTGGNNAGGNRGSAGFSVYFKCDSTREERADELVAKTLGPIYQKHVDAGHLTSWGWLQHNVGGKWRRALTSTATDHKTMMKTRDAIVEEMTSGRTEKAATEFDGICNSHQDYMWDVQFETP